MSQDGNNHDWVQPHYSDGASTSGPSRQTPDSGFTPKQMQQIAQILRSMNENSGATAQLPQEKTFDNSPLTRRQVKANQPLRSLIADDDDSAERFGVYDGNGDELIKVSHRLGMDADSEVLPVVIHDTENEGRYCLFGFVPVGVRLSKQFSKKFFPLTEVHEGDELVGYIMQVDGDSTDDEPASADRSKESGYKRFRAMLVFASVVLLGLWLGISLSVQAVSSLPSLPGALGVGIESFIACFIAIAMIVFSVGIGRLVAKQAWKFGKFINKLMKED